jgi:hypothetical protein
MHTQSSPRELSHPPAAKCNVCHSAALRGQAAVRKPAPGLRKNTLDNTLQGLRPALLFINPVVRQQAALVTTR